MKKLLCCLLTLAFAASFPASAEAGQAKAKGKKAAPKTLLQRFDKNGNGVIDETETAAVQKAFKRGKNPQLQKLDKDKDGTLSSGEIYALQKGRAKGKKKANK
jgi:Ca2+-binding EF-hand superfamily protein